MGKARCRRRGKNQKSSSMSSFPFFASYDFFTIVFTFLFSTGWPKKNTQPRMWTGGATASKNFAVDKFLFFNFFFGQPMSFNVFSHRDEYKTGLNPPKLAENGQAKANCHREQWYHHVGIPKLAEKSFKHWFWVFCCIFSYVKCVLTSAKKFRKLGDR